MTPDNKPRGGWLEYWQIFDKHGDMIRIGSIRGECPENGDKVVQLVERETYAALEAKYHKAVGALERIEVDFVPTYKGENELAYREIKEFTATVLSELGE